MNGPDHYRLAEHDMRRMMTAPEGSFQRASYACQAQLHFLAASTAAVADLVTIQAFPEDPTADAWRSALTALPVADTERLFRTFCDHWDTIRRALELARDAMPNSHFNPLYASALAALDSALSTDGDL